MISKGKPALRMRSIFVAVMMTTCAALPASGKPVFDPAFTSSMVLQRNRVIPVRGTAEPGAPVTVDVDGKRTTAHADKQGRWAATLPAHAAGSGHRISASDPTGTTTLDDVAFGDVWLCSGQSNMEFTLRHATNADVEVAGSANADLRLFNMPRQSSTTPQARPSTSVAWQRSAPESAADFSAACWFMGRDLQQHQNIPIGLIASSWGGSVIEDWLDRETLGKVEYYRDDLKMLDAYASDPKAGMAMWATHLKNWLGTRASAPANAKWQPVPSLTFWEDWGGAMRNFDGIGYYRAHVMLGAAQVGSGVLDLGSVDDSDLTRINGQIVGQGQGWNTQRRYEVPAGVLKPGDNLIEITALDSGGGGGIWGGPPTLTLIDGTSIPLEKFEFAQGAALSETGSPPPMPWIGGSGRTTLFNGMIAPLGDYPVTGFAWYQGESNAAEPKRYEQLLALLANQWRARFGGKPFIMVQLANYGPLASEPRNDTWGAFRDSQRRIAAADPQIGLASAIDIGQPGDIHPTNKLDVGHRLALEARRLALGEHIVSRGPSPLSAKRNAQGIVINFANGPLRVIGSDVAIGFELCDAGSQCRFVSARTKGSNAILPDDPHARTVRFLWQASPIVNLYNDAMLPATSFEMPIE